MTTINWLVTYEYRFHHYTGQIGTLINATELMSEHPATFLANSKLNFIAMMGDPRKIPDEGCEEVTAILFAMPVYNAERDMTEDQLCAIDYGRRD